MTASTSNPWMTFDEYLSFDERAEVRHEFVGGQIYAMVGASERHDLATQFLYERLAPTARAKGCRPWIHNRRLKVATASYYPDVFVVCSPASHRLYETDAVLVIEVLSPATASSDRREKLVAYGALPSFGQYLLVDPYWREIAEALPDGGRLGGFRWITHGAGDLVMTPYGDIDVDALHDHLDSMASAP